MSRVSIHTPTKGVTMSGSSMVQISVFQSTHPRRVWRLIRCRFRLLRCCFNPHTHEGCDCALNDEQGAEGVSIHTPTKGVTDGYRLLDYEFNVSIHTPTKGVTCLWEVLGDDLAFQSTHPRRVWREVEPFRARLSLVSIHTPTKGVTSGFFCESQIIEVSIHTPTKGVTCWTEPSPLASASFNPHTHEGCDSCFMIYPQEHLMFQSTHPRRVWHIDVYNFITASVFQSTHPRRVWHSDS